MKRRVVFTAERFIEHPELFDAVREAWERKEWYVLFGEFPDSAVFAEVPPEGGIVFHYRVRDGSDT